MRPYVLVVEDDAALSKALCEILEARGYEAGAARDGELALDLLAHAPIPKLIVLDLILPRLDGWNLLREFEVAGIPVLVISALPERQVTRGVTSYLPKPFGLDRFVAEVERLCPAPRNALSERP